MSLTMPYNALMQTMTSSDEGLLHTPQFSLTHMSRHTKNTYKTTATTTNTTETKKSNIAEVKKIKNMHVIRAGGQKKHNI